MDPIRVLHLARVINRYDWIDTVVRYLPRERFHMEVATFEPKANIAEPHYEALGIPHSLLRVPGMRAYGAYLRAAGQLARLLRTRRIQILHTHHYWEGIVGALAKVLCPHFIFLLHRHYTEDIVRVSGAKGHLLRRLEAWSYTKADRLLVPTESMREWIQVAYGGRPLPPLEVIPYGFELEAPKYKPLSSEERLRARAEAGITPEEVVIVNVGSHRRQKGQFELVRAFCRLAEERPGARLWLVGAGPDSEALRQAALPAAERITFWGWKDAQAVRTLIGAADIVAHPSYSEAFPQVMVEALALERALVITPVSGARDWLVHAQHAWIVPIGDESALYEALKGLSVSPALREKLGRSGAQLVRTHFSYSAVNPLYEKLYTDLCHATRICGHPCAQ